VLAQLFLAYIDYGEGIDYNKIQKWLPYSLLMYVPASYKIIHACTNNILLSFSFFMLCGLVITVLWLPRIEHNADGKVKSLEEWQDGREANGFSRSWMAKIVAKLYHSVANVWKKIGGAEEEEELEMEHVGGNSEGERC